MTPFDLIDSIFSRVQPGTAGNVRRITPGQLKYLRDLIDADPEGGAVSRGAPGSLVWKPGGRWKYIVTEDLSGQKHTLTRIGRLNASDTGRLF